MRSAARLFAGCVLLVGISVWGGAVPSAPAAAGESARHFEATVAPLLAQHCLECHRTAAKKGSLDLSRREAALAGGDSGEAIVPGNAADSLLWIYVDSDDMPKDRPPLSADQKRLLQEWIDGGADWSVDVIEYGHYAPDRDSSSGRLRRLTVPEYIETVRHAVGVEIEEEARRLLPPDIRADGFSNTAYNLRVDLAHVEGYSRLAAIIVERMDVGAFAANYSQSQELSEENMRRLISGMGKWLLRGILDEEEIAAYLVVSTAVAEEDGDFLEAVQYILTAMLQSPRFLYRVETEGGEGAPRPVTDFELASRLSYILWGGPPDEELMRAAEAGELADQKKVEAQVRRMLDDRRAVEWSTRFIHEWMHLDRMSYLRPSRERFSHWDDRLAADMREETLAFFKEIAWEQRRPLWDLMNAQMTFATPRLAAHYGLGRVDAAQPPADGLLALYTFQEGSGQTVHDVSGVDEPIHLQIADTSAVRWSDEGLTVDGSTLITSENPPRRLIDALKTSKAVTLEAWCTPGDARQNGPARILTLSSGISQRNFTLGQDGDKFDVRFRATKTDGNGMPGLASPSGSVAARPTHVIYTRDASGKARLYVDGQEQAAGDVGGDLANWDKSFRLALANETSNDRPWLGTYHRVAVYNRALAPEEIRVSAAGLARYDVSAVPARGGLLTQGSVLTAGGDEASMVTRGLFLLRELLYSNVEDPPPCVDTTPVATKPGQSQRQIAMERVANQACADCHGKFEPMAYGLEKFDGIGAYHEKDEHGNTLREDGEILFPGEEQPISYQTSAELMDLLADSERVRRGITRKVTQFAIGRPLRESDEPILNEIHEAALKGDGTYASLITAIVMSELVQMTGSPSVQ